MSEPAHRPARPWAGGGRFRRIYVDRFGDVDRGAGVEVELARLLGRRP